MRVDLPLLCLAILEIARNENSTLIFGMKTGAFIPSCQSRGKPVFGSDRPWLAPLAGYSDLPFRMLCREYGAKVTESEMVSAKGLAYGTPATSKLLANLAEDSPLVVQLFGSEPETLAKAVRMLREKGFNNFDFNLGCPVRKVFRQHSGAALLDDVPLLRKMAKTLIKAIKDEMPEAALPPGCIGFKLRSGTRPDKAVLPDLALLLEDLGADWLAIHPRFASQGYGGFANWRHISDVASRTEIPVLASGDLWNAAQGMKCLEETGATGLMYARGALYNPAIFSDHLNLLQKGKAAETTLADIINIIKKHIAITRSVDNSQRAFIKMRSLVPRYTRAFTGAQNLRKAVCQCDNWEDLENLVSRLPEKFAYAQVEQ